MNVQDAVYNTAHDYPGGIPALAVRMGVSANVLQNKVNPTQDTHKLSVGEAEKMIAFTGDRRIPDAFASLVGCVLVKAGGFEGVSDMALLDAYSQLMSELGDFSMEFNKTLQDGKITPAEINLLESKLYDFQRAGSELLNRARQLVEPEKVNV